VVTGETVGGLDDDGARAIASDMLHHGCEARALVDGIGTYDAIVACIQQCPHSFDDPIDLPNGRKLITLKDAATYITKLPRTEHAAHGPRCTEDRC
jgi:hypothetical protein